MHDDEGELAQPQHCRVGWTRGGATQFRHEIISCRTICVASVPQMQSEARIARKAPRGCGGHRFLHRITSAKSLPQSAFEPRERHEYRLVRTLRNAARKAMGWLPIFNVETRQPPLTVFSPARERKKKRVIRFTAQRCWHRQGFPANSRTIASKSTSIFPQSQSPAWKFSFLPKPAKSRLGRST